MSTLHRIHCVVAYATPERQWNWSVDLHADATIADALTAARAQAANEEVPWDSAPVGIFGVRLLRAAPLRDGDRVEIYRPLAGDARERRRRRARHLPGSGGGSSGA